MNSLDILVIIGYFVGIVAFGLWISRNSKGSEGYFLGGRKFRWWTMMGQAFGTGTHAEMPVAQAGASFQMGFATIWFQWKNMLITPFYWLIGPWYRRSNCTTSAELLTARYGRTVGMIYAIFAIVFFVFVMGTMLQGAAKVIVIASGSTISPNTVILGMTAAFMLYSFFGGLTAAAHTEFIQAFFIIILSFMLIPLGLNEVGGFSAMRAALPEDFFMLHNQNSGLGGFTIAMLALNGIIGITAQPHMMSMFATGNTERAGRIGQTYGNFVKRLVTIGWALTGLVVAAMVIKNEVVLEDPEHAFGYAARELLAPGLTGLLMACILAANMSSCSNFMVNLGALFTRDIYTPYINPKADDKKLLSIGRFSGLILTAFSVLFALQVGNVLSAFLFVETIAAFMGIIFFGGFMWKRANRFGAIAAISVAFISYYILNYLETDTFQLIYTWKAIPFAWAMFLGFLALIIGSLLTPPEPEAENNAFFDNMEHLSVTDSPTGKRIEAGAAGAAMILLDAPGWFNKERWINFWQRYKEDAYGFLLAWCMVAFLLAVAWSILQIP